MRIAVLGAGFTGLTAAYELAKIGHEVTVFEKEERAGGLARGFKLPGWDWYLEESYHHLFASDKVAIDFIKELGLADDLFFRKPVTGVYYEKFKAQREKLKATTQNLKVSIQNSRVYPLDTPLNFLLFPHLSPADKLRSAATLAYLKLKNDWQDLEKVPAKEWLQKTMGKRAWQVLWEPLFLNKFGQKYTQEVSAAWFWARIKKRTQSLGYIRGGFQALAEKLVKEIKRLGGEVNLNTTVTKISSFKRKSVRNIKIQVKNSWADRIMNFYFDRVVASLPTPVFLRLTQGLPQNYIKRLSSIKHLYAQTLILSLKKPFLEKTYWLNICNRRFPFLLLVDHTNFTHPRHYGNHHLLYIGNYLPQGHPYLKKSKEELLKIFLPYLKKINPSFHATRYTLHATRFTSPFAQPVFPKSYSQIKPDFVTPLPGLYLANQDQIYPWDRGVNFAIELGKGVADRVEPCHA